MTQFVYVGPQTHFYCKAEEAIINALSLSTLGKLAVIKVKGKFHQSQKIEITFLPVLNREGYSSTS